MLSRRIIGLGLVLILLVAGFAACGGPSGPEITAHDVWARPAMAGGGAEGGMGQGGVQLVGQGGSGGSQGGSQGGSGGGQGGSQGSPGGGQGMAAPGTGAVFMLLKNGGGEPDRLVGGRTDVAEVVEVHETVMDGEVMKMQMLSAGLEVPARGEVLLKPGSYHVMLIGMKRNLEVGETFTLDLQFEKSGTITVQPEVRQP